MSYPHPDPLCAWREGSFFWYHSVMLTLKQITSRIGDSIRRGNVWIRVKDYEHAERLYRLQSNGYEFEI